MTFQIHTLPYGDFEPLFDLSDEELSAKGMRRMTVDQSPGTPCRVSMTDAKVGERVILVNYEHQPENSPYQASHAIFVREGAEQATLDIGDVPEVITSRLMSVRLFDDAHMMIDADVVEGTKVAQAIDAAFANDAVRYIHLHNAKPGCFSASVTRAKG
ncbi:MAG: DUF1203 domain-containing protein [Pseudomonadota bacterium]